MNEVLAVPVAHWFEKLTFITGIPAVLKTIFPGSVPVYVAGVPPGNVHVGVFNTPPPASKTAEGSTV